MSPRQILLSAAVIFLLGGLIFGLQPRGVDGDYGDSTNCGSAFRPESDVDALDGITGADTPSECDEVLGTMKILSLGGLGLAGIAFIGAFVAPASRLGIQNDT